MDILPFLLFLLFCTMLVGVICGLFWLLRHFGGSEADERRTSRCPQCGTRRKPRKTGRVRNLVEVEFRCLKCGYHSWDVPPKTSLSKPPTDQFPRNRTQGRKEDKKKKIKKRAWIWQSKPSRP